MHRDFPRPVHWLVKCLLCAHRFGSADTPLARLPRDVFFIVLGLVVDQYVKTEATKRDLSPYRHMR